MTMAAPVRSLELVELAVGDGTTMHAHVARPQHRTASSPGVLVLQDAYGWTGFLADICEQYAAMGFTAIAPELYHRNGHGISYSYDDDSITKSDERPKTNADTMIADGIATYDWLRNDIGNDRIAAFGFCMGGRMAYLLNSQRPLRAAISFYGGGCHKLLEYAKTQHGTMLFVWAGIDENISAKQTFKVSEGLFEAGVDHEQVTFAKAHHGFFCHTRPWVHSPSAVAQSWAISKELYRIQGIVD